MVAPVAKGIIVATTLLLAAGLAAYENEQIRNWIEAQRRKIAVALSGGYGPGGATDAARNEKEAENLAMELKDEVIRRHREEIFERARNEGVAVDWDELAAVEMLYEEQARKAAEDAASSSVLDEKAPKRRGSAQTFDEIVGSDGMLKDRDVTAGSTTGVAGGSAFGGLRQRGLFGLGRGAAFANPFDDEAQLLFDQELIGAGGEELAGISRSGNTSRTISAEPELQNLVDVHETPYKTDAELEVEIEEAIRRSLEDVTTTSPVTVIDEPLIQVEGNDDATPEAALGALSPTPMQTSLYESYYYGGLAPSPSYHSATQSPAPPSTATLDAPTPATLLPSQSHAANWRGEPHADEDSDDALTPAGTLTPTTEAGFDSLDGDALSPEDSLYGEPSGVFHSLELGDLLRARVAEQQQQQQRGQDREGHDEAEAESSDGFSVVDGAATPGSWTDVESVGGFEEEEHVVGRS